MVAALQIEFDLSSQAVSSDVHGFVRVTSGNPLTENARTEEIPNRAKTRASYSSGGVSGAMVTRNVLASVFPGSVAFGFAVILGFEKSKSLGEVSQRLGIKLEQAHRAEHDAEAALLVMLAFFPDTRVPRTYGAFLQEQRRLSRIFDEERRLWRSKIPEKTA